MPTHTGDSESQIQCPEAASKSQPFRSYRYRCGAWLFVYRRRACAVDGQFKALAPDGVVICAVFSVGAVSK